MLHLATLDSPVGALAIVSRENRVCLLHFGGEDEYVRGWIERWYRAEPVERVDDPAGAVSALRRYFDGELTAINALEIELNGTPFQRRVWERLRDVKAGTTASYAQLAADVGASHAVRAVGAANGANPVAIIVPCHRIIGSNGGLTGYGGGLDRKEWLLRHEGVLGRLF